MGPTVSTHLVILVLLLVVIGTASTGRGCARLFFFWGWGLISSGGQWCDCSVLLFCLLTGSGSIDERASVCVSVAVGEISGNPIDTRETVRPDSPRLPDSSVTTFLLLLLLRPFVSSLLFPPLSYSSSSHLSLCPVYGGTYLPPTYQSTNSAGQSGPASSSPPIRFPFSSVSPVSSPS